MVMAHAPIADLETDAAPRPSFPGQQGGIRLSILGSFELDRHGIGFLIPGTAQRLLAFLAVNRSPIHRTYVAGTLWPEMSDQRASGNLRTTLWRLHGMGVDVVHLHGDNVALDPVVEVDLHAVYALAQRLVRAPFVVDDPRIDHLVRAGELLPGWYDDWVVPEREMLRELRQRALEQLCHLYAAADRFGDAIEAGLAAIAGDPLRESSHRALISAHLLEGNHAQALRQYRRYRADLESELGVAPSHRMVELLEQHGLATISA